MKKIIILLFCLFYCRIFADNSGGELIFAFKDHDRIQAQRMILVGEIVSIEKAHTIEAPIETDLNLDTRPDNVVVKVLNPTGVRVGQTLYLIEKDPNHKKFRNGSIVGQITVRSIFDTTFFGKQLRGEGYTRMIEDRHIIVARLIETKDTEKAIALKKKGDAHYYRNEIPEAMKLYREAIATDAKLADAHYALAKVYKKEPNGEFTMFGEYARAWEHRENFSELRERIQFYHDYMEAIYQLGNNIKPLLLKRLKEILNNYNQLVGSTYEYELYSAYFHYREFLNAVKNYEKQSYHLEKAKEHLKNTKKYPQETLMYHELAILITHEDLENWTFGRPITDKVQAAIQTIRQHGRRYLLINPPGRPIPIDIIQILERIPD